MKEYAWVLFNEYGAPFHVAPQYCCTRDDAVGFFSCYGEEIADGISAGRLRVLRCRLFEVGPT